MTTTEPVAPIEDIPDSCELLDTGRVRLIFSGRTITLRPVKMGELKALKRAYFEEPAPKVVDGKPVVPTLADASDAGFDRWAAWVRKTVDTLGDAKLTAKQLGELPGAWCSMNFAAILIQHWQSVPLPRGASAPA